VSGARIFGKVLGRNGAVVSGATVKVVLNALDSHHSNTGNNTVASGTTDSSGNYSISVSSLPLGSIVDISVTVAGYTGVMVFGTYDETSERVDFDDFEESDKGDRRLPLGDVMPPLPFEGLLPD
jgi:hypothetical protein